jgi:hypothetical protein
MIRLTGPRQRDYAKSVIDGAPDGYCVIVKEPTRSIEQNAKLWAMLEDVSRAEPMGRKHSPDDWKAIFMHACGWEVQFLPGLDHVGFFPVGYRSSRLTVKQMATLITFIQAWGDEQGVQFSEPNPWEGAA